VQRHRAVGLLGVGDRHHRRERHLREAPAVAVLKHRAGRSVLIGGDDDAFERAQRQVREHVAVGEARDQQLLGVPALGLAPERRVGARLDHRLALHDEVVIAPVFAVVRRALAGIAGPAHGDLVVVLATAHGALLPISGVEPKS
jgi:hypothetical protein